MKNLILIIVYLGLTISTKSQTISEKYYLNDMCECLDSLKLASPISDDALGTCFQIAIQKKTDFAIQECLKLYGNATEESINKYEVQLGKQIRISLIDSCTTYFIYADSSRYKKYTLLNKDSLSQQRKLFESIDSVKRDNKYYNNRSLLYFELGLYHNALEDIDRLLLEDSTNIKILYLKAWINEIKGNYQEAIFLYEQVATLSNIYLFHIYTKIVQRKKNGL